MEDALQVSLNGVTQQVGSGTTVDVLVRQLRGAPDGVAVALNEEVVPRSRWASTVLTHHDRIEVLVATQGG